MSLLLFTVFISTTLLALIFFKLLKQVFNVTKNKKEIHGPKGLPYIGKALEFLPLSNVDVFKRINEYTAQFDYRLKANMAWHKFVMVAVPEDIEAIMTDHRFLEKSEDYNKMSAWLREGLLMVSNKKKWQKRRKTLTPAFHFSILEDFVQVMNQQAAILTNILKMKVNKEGFDVCPYISLYTLDVICETSMGTEINAQTGGNLEYVKAIVEICSIFHWRHHHFLARDDWFWKLTPTKRRHDYLVKFLHSHTQKIIKERRAEKEKRGKNGNNLTDDTGIRKRTALMDILLDSTIDGEKLSDNDIQEETDNFMFAGHDTTTSGINFLLYNLAKHQDIQQKVYEEIIDVLGSDPTSELSVKDLNSFKYFELVIKESLRMFSPVPMMGRFIREDIEVNGVVYPKNHNILIGIHILHHNPNIFPEPEKFIPERFLENVSHEKKNAFGYVPFAGGYRNCIGQKFAQLEMKAVTARILQNFKLELADPDFEPILTAEVVLKSVNGINIKLKSRN